MGATGANDRLAVVMREAGCSHKRLARLVRELGRQRGLRVSTDHTAVSRWLTGRVRSPRVAPLIAEALGLELGRTVNLEEIGFGHLADLPTELGRSYLTSASDVTAVLAQVWQADIDRRAVLEQPANGRVWHEVPLTWLVASPAQPTGAGGGRRVGMTDVEAFRATVELFAQLDNTHGGGYARQALIAYLHSTLTPLLGGSFSETVGRALYTAAAQATLLAAWMSYDAGQHGLGQRYFVQAVGLAEAGGDRALAGSVLSAMSHQATFLGRYREAVNLARAAQMGVERRVSPVQRAQLHAMEARALALLQDARACDDALSAATTALERDDGGAPAWIRYFNERELAAEIGHCFRDLGRAESAARYAEQAVDGGCGRRSDFFAEMVAADAYRAAGEHEQALTTALGALRLGEGLDSGRCQAYVTQFRQQLPAKPSPAVRELVEQAALSPLWRETVEPLTM